MTREKAKKILPIIQAYAEGKTIQTKRLDGTWVDFEPQISKDIGINFENGEHRVKPEEVLIETTTCEEKYTRPFKDCEELIEYWYDFTGVINCSPKLFMPTIWVKSKEYGTDNLITAFDGDNESIGGSCVFIQDMWVDMKELFDNFTFLDGTPCGK